MQNAKNGTGIAFTGRIATWSARHSWWIVAASVALVVISMFIIIGVGTDTRDDDEAPGEAGKAQDLIEERFSEPIPVDQPLQGPTEQLVFLNPSLTADHPDYISTVERVGQQLEALPEVARVVTFYDTEDPSMVSGDRHALRGLLTFDASHSRSSQVDVIFEAIDSAEQSAPGFEIGMVGFVSVEIQADRIIEEDFGRVLLFSLVIGLIILLLAFRAAVAAVVPLAMAVAAIISAIAVATLVSKAYPLVDFYTAMVELMGLAVGIDYSLFILSRFRNERTAGWAKLDAIARACSTTGRAVFYAGFTVVLSLTGLMLAGDATFISLALGAVIVVAIAILGSLTLLPAMLHILGNSVNRLRVPFMGAESTTGGVWGTITDSVLARPAVLATITAAALIALAVPVLYLNLGSNQASSVALPESLDGKRPLEILEEHFTGGLASPAEVVIGAPSLRTPEVQNAVDTMLARMGEDELFFAPFETRENAAADALIVRVPLSGEVDGDEAERGITRLREDIIPAAFQGTDAVVYVGGDTAGSLDFRNKMFDRAPIVFAFVLGLAFILLLVMFRSIIIPVKAIILNLLSVAAAYGVLVIVFQWGWGISILGSEASGVIESWLPLFLFGILFGLSMDYHMLLLNRIKEAYDRGATNEESVSQGVKVTAGQITSAALIMVGVFSTFAISQFLFFQQFGIGLAVAVLVDATIIRAILLPASMKLLGDFNWYFPRWLEWLPDFTPEIDAGEPAPTAPPPS